MRKLKPATPELTIRLCDSVNKRKQLNAHHYTAITRTNTVITSIFIVMTSISLDIYN